MTDSVGRLTAIQEIADRYAAGPRPADGSGF